MDASACGGQTQWMPLMLELQVVVSHLTWMMGVKFSTSKVLEVKTTRQVTVIKTLQGYLVSRSYPKVLIMPNFV